MIRTFGEWNKNKYEDYPANAIAEDCYDAGVKEASDHFEEEKIRIHEYYQIHMNKLMGTEEFKADENNGGKLT